MKLKICAFFVKSSERVFKNYHVTKISSLVLKESPCWVSAWELWLLYVCKSAQIRSKRLEKLKPMYDLSNYFLISILHHLQEFYIICILLMAGGTLTFFTDRPVGLYLLILRAPDLQKSTKSLYFKDMWAHHHRHYLAKMTYSTSSTVSTR